VNEICPLRHHCTFFDIATHDDRLRSKRPTHVARKISIANRMPTVRKAQGMRKLLIVRARNRMSAYVLHRHRSDSVRAEPFSSRPRQSRKVSKKSPSWPP
jgi:hypothetical protein